MKNLKDFLGDELSDTYLENILDEVHGTHDHLITYQEFLGLWNSDADEDLATARLNVGCRRLSRTSLASSFSDVDDLGETYQRIAGNDATKPLTSASRTGSFYYMANRDTSMMKAVAHDADAFIL